MYLTQPSPVLKSIFLAECSYISYLSLVFGFENVKLHTPLSNVSICFFANALQAPSHNNIWNQNLEHFLWFHNNTEQFGYFSTSSLVQACHLLRDLASLRLFAIMGAILGFLGALAPPPPPPPPPAPPKPGRLLFMLPPGIALEGLKGQRTRKDDNYIGL